MRNDGSSTATSGRSDYDPLVANARRELLVTLIAFVVFGMWVVGVSWWSGREPVVDPNDIRTILGMPAWVFWGVALPWAAANGFTFWFCFRFMANDALDDAVEEVLHDPHNSRMERSS